MSALLPGVYTARHKDNSIYYRASVTFKNKHISLGSFETEADAHKAYTEALTTINDPSVNIENYHETCTALSFGKYVVIINYRDNDVYIPNPIYVRPRLFYYYFDPGDFFIFSGEDLFYYSAHRIQRRGGHYFVADYGSQISILSRYGIRSHAVPGKDYVFLNGNNQDMQYSNIKVINAFNGVRMDEKGSFEVKIHVNGYIKVGLYNDAVTAAIAYNKAVDILKENVTDKTYSLNYIDGLSPKAYADIYAEVNISEKIYKCRP